MAAVAEFRGRRVTEEQVAALGLRCHPLRAGWERAEGWVVAEAVGSAGADSKVVKAGRGKAAAAGFPVPCTAG